MDKTNLHIKAGISDTSGWLLKKLKEFILKEMTLIEKILQK